MQDRAKRLFDVLVCLALAPFAVAVGAVVAVAVRVTSGPPVLHRGPRMGRGGAPFAILKFRTMTVGAAGPRVTAGDDRRITPVGRWLRRTKLDELPQLVNVLRGEMSLVGPRPEDPAFRPHYTGPFAPVLAVRPGITGPAAIRFRHEETLLRHAAAAGIEDHYVTAILPAKLALDLEYALHHTFLGDLALLGATLRAVLRSDAA